MVVPFVNKIEDPGEKYLVDLDSEMTEIANGSNMAADDKIKMYNQTLQKFLVNYVRPKTAEPQPSVIQAAPVESIVEPKQETFERRENSFNQTTNNKTKFNQLNKKLFNIGHEGLQMLKQIKANTNRPKYKKINVGEKQNATGFYEDDIEPLVDAPTISKARVNPKHNQTVVSSKLDFSQTNDNDTSWSLQDNTTPNNSTIKNQRSNYARNNNQFAFNNTVDDTFNGSVVDDNVNGSAKQTNKAKLATPVSEGSIKASAKARKIAKQYPNRHVQNTRIVRTPVNSRVPHIRGKDEGRSPIVQPVDGLDGDKWKWNAKNAQE